ncbi:MAG: hypothetical protein M3Q30_05425 [Actinomycetota bacterium]|nr:hypothetical protein [Actinomycetota bacterium]
MARDPRPAVVFLRMSPQLREGLRNAAADAGCSLNSFSVQVLAAAAGDPVRFRVSGSHEESEAPDVDELERDALGYPLRWKERWAHSGARNEFIGTMGTELGSKEMVALVKRLDAEDPGYFVEWQRLRMAEREVQESGDRRGAA